MAENNKSKGAAIHRAEQEKQHLQRQVESLWRIAQMTDASHDELCDLALEEIQKLTDSQYSFFGFLTKDESALIVQSWSRTVMTRCAVADRPIHFPIKQAGLWSRAVIEREPLIVNDYHRSHAHKKGLPDGHVPLKRFLAVPILQKGRVAALAAVADKADDYTHEDVLQIQTFVSNILLVIQKRCSAERLNESEQMCRSVLENATEGIFQMAASGKILTCNRAAAEIFGITPEDAVGETTVSKAWPVIHEDGSKYESENYPSLKTLRTGKPCRNVVMGAYRPDGTLRWILANSNPLFRNNETAPYAVTVSFSDITDLKKEKDLSQTYLDIAGVMLMALNANGDIVSINKKGCEILDASEDDLLGKNWFETCLLSSSVQKERQVFGELMAGRIASAEYSESKVQTLMGKEKIIAWHNTVIKNDAGEFTGTFSSGEDITERKAAEESLRHERDMTNQVMETSPVGIIRLDAHGQIVYANRQAETALGFQKSGFVGRIYNDPAWKFTDMVGRPLPEENIPFYIVQKTGKAVSDMQFAVQWADGRKVFLSSNATPMFDDVGNFNGVVASIADITATYEAEQKYQMLFREMLNGFSLQEVICDDQGEPVDYRCLDVNPAFERLTGYQREKVIGRTILEIVPQMNPNVIETLGRVALTGEPVFLEYFFHKIGRYFQIVAFRPAPNQFACLFADTTESKKSEEALQKSAEQHRSILETAMDGYWMADSSGRFLEINQTYCRMSGYSEKELLSMNIADVEANETAEQVLAHMKTLAAKGEDRFESRHRRKDGTVYDIEASVQYRADDGGRFICFSRDITENRKMEARLAQAQKMESIGNLAAGIAHDFNNILSPIVGLGDMLIDDLPMGSSEHRSAKEILKAGMRGRDLVQQILAFSRQSENRKAPVRFQSILREVIKLIRSSIPTNIDINQDIQKECGMIMADPTQLHQIAMNLLTNAYHALGDTDGQIDLQLKEVVLEANDHGTALKAGHYARFTVTDTGCGIHLEMMDKIFEPYFTTKEKGKGTGLGLAVVFGMVKEHGGGIKVYSELGNGTTFTVYIPIVEDSDGRERQDTPEQLPGGNERILIVDDESSIVDMERMIMERLGYQVTVRFSSVDALEAFKAAPAKFDLVITDMTMPNMTGDRLAKALIAIRPDIPIIICTGFSEKLNRDMAEAIGVRGFLMKPIVRSELAKTVRKALDESR